MSDWMFIGEGRSGLKESYLLRLLNSPTRLDSSWRRSTEKLSLVSVTLCSCVKSVCVEPLEYMCIFLISVQCLRVLVAQLV